MDVLYLLPFGGWRDRVCGDRGRAGGEAHVGHDVAMMP
jgi:hypothetical protein